MIMSYLYDLINDHRIARRVWKIQINMRVNFISAKDTGETRTIYTSSDNVQALCGVYYKRTDGIIKELFEWIINFIEYV